MSGPVFPWRMYPGGLLGAALAVAACLAWSLTPVEGAAAAAVLTLTGIALGGVLDVRASARRAAQAGRTAR